MAATKGPQFYFELDGQKYGARNLTIAEQARCLAEVERLTNGNYKDWAKDPMAQYVAFNTQAAVYLNVVICQWPIGMEAIDFLTEDDPEKVARYWEAFVKASEIFRPRKRSEEESGTMGGDISSQEMVPGSIPSVATR